MTMEPAGLAIGIAGIFSTCLDVIERVDSYRDFGVESRAIIAQFEADKLLFQQWGKYVGIDGVTLRDDHHKSFRDTAILSAVQKILSSIQEIAGSPVETPFGQKHGFGPVNSRAKPDTSRHLPFQKLLESSSRRTKVEWTLRNKTRFIAWSQQFGSLVDRLRALVPPESANGDNLMAEKTCHGIPPSVSGVYPFPDHQIEAASRFIDSQKILMEMERQIERERPPPPEPVPC